MSTSITHQHWPYANPPLSTPGSDRLGHPSARNRLQQYSDPSISLQQVEGHNSFRQQSIPNTPRSVVKWRRHLQPTTILPHLKSATPSALVWPESTPCSALSSRQREKLQPYLSELEIHLFPHFVHCLPSALLYTPVISTAPKNCMLPQPAVYMMCCLNRRFCTKKVTAHPSTPSLLLHHLGTSKPSS